MKLVVGQFNDSYMPITDGVGFVTKNYAYWLNKKYGKAYVITTSMPKYKDKGDIPVLRYISIPVPKRKPYRYGFPQFDFKFQNEFKKIKFDIVHAHSPFVAGNLALKTARKLKIPIVASFHTKYHEDFKSVIPIKSLVNLSIKSIAKFYNSVDLVLVPNKSTISTLKKYGYNGKAEVMANGTDLIPPKNIGKLAMAADEDFGTSKNDFVFMFIGQHIWEKNLKMMINALDIISKKSRKFKAIFIGGGYAEDEMKNMIKQKGLGEKIKLMGIVRDRKKIMNYYARANLLLFPSLYDTSPLTLREAAAFNLPTLLINGATAAEGIIDGKNGFLSENNPESYAKKIISLMDNKNIIRKCGRGAKESLYRTWETVTDEVMKKYLELIKNFKNS